jgi:peptidoglycan/xylan/chitin deacetylase (PgdA/CDA1 family)
MRTSLKSTLFHISKWLGLFHLARFVTRRGLRILCYHGFSVLDERRFRPKLFIDAARFNRRLEFLSRNHFPLLTLEQALDLLDVDKFPSCATVITIDDGFSNVYEAALPVLRKHSCPATVYVYTEPSLAAEPVFRLVVQYMFWKTRQEEADLSGLGLPELGRVSLNDGARNDVVWQIIGLGENECDASRRSALAQTLGERLGVDFGAIVQRRSFHIMSPEQLREMIPAGIDIQLHTHRHQLPRDQKIVQQEIAANRAVLEPIVRKSLKHFCYPSGIWSEDRWPWLHASGIKSAVTCDAGLNYPSTPRLALKRFLDADNISDIEFEAEMYGYSELLRRIRDYTMRLLHLGKHQSQSFAD